MDTKREFIIDAIIKVAKTNRIEGLEDDSIVTIRGLKRGFLKNEDILIQIERSSIEPTFNAFVIAEINKNKQSDDIPKETLYNILRKTEILDSKLEWKLDVIFNNKQLIYKDGQLQIIGNPSLLEEMINNFNTQIEVFFPELINNLKITVNRKDIVFDLKNGLDDPAFDKFYQNGILLKSAIPNYKKSGVEKFVFVDLAAGVFDDISVEDIENMDLD